MQRKVIATITTKEAEACEVLFLTNRALNNLLMVIEDNPDIKAEFFPHDHDITQIHEKVQEGCKRYADWWDSTLNTYNSADIDRHHLHLDFSTGVITNIN